MEKTYIGNDVTLVEDSVWVNGYQSPAADFYISNPEGGYHLDGSDETFDRVSADKATRTQIFNANRACSDSLVSKMDALESKLNHAISNATMNLSRYA
jgi:hypothetical protein